MTERSRLFRFRDETGHILTDDLQVHLLELTKLDKTRENLSMATPAERWAYFLLHAESMTMEEIRSRFPEPEFVEAAGVLEVIKQNPDQMNDYISRLKYQKDEDWRLQATRMEALQEGEAKGRVEGEAKGKLIGSIVTLHEVLGLPIPTPEELSACNAMQLSDRLEQLRNQVRNR